MLLPRTIALLAGGALIFGAGAIAPSTASAAEAPKAAASPNNVTAAQYSDEDFLNAVLFGIGPVASAVGIHVSDEVALPDDYEDLASAALAEFRELRGESADTAIAAFRTGNPILVHDAVKTVQADFTDLFLEGEPKVENGVMCAAVNVVLAGNLAVVINVGFAVAVAFVTYVATASVINDSEAQVISARLADAGVK